MNDYQQVIPIMIFSLPRSGSTLVQRVLGSHDKIATASEPWILLPFLYPLRGEGLYAEYNHESMLVAFSDFCNTLPKKQDDYVIEVGKMALALYKKSGNNAPYFLDKTPRYHTISNYIVKAFPDGKFIFLWRHPLANAASIMETFSSGRWNLYRYKIDLYSGLECLIDTYSSSNGMYAVRFEDLISEHREGVWKGVFDYLGIEFDDAVLEKFSESKLQGRWGDPTGVKQYDKISNEPLEKWKKTMGNPLRKWWGRRYLKWIGRERLAVMGYDYDILQDEIGSCPFTLKYFFSDIILMLFGFVYCWIEPHILMKKLKYILKSKYAYVHR